MNSRPEETLLRDATTLPRETSRFGAPTLAEDILLLLFQPDSATIAGEGTLFYILAGAVLTDLALEERVTVTTSAAGTVLVAAAQGRAPADEILRSTWDHVSDKPRPVQRSFRRSGRRFANRCLIV